MKIEPLLAEFLVRNRRLELPGIGSFILEPGEQAYPESGKSTHAPDLEGTLFEGNPGIRDSPDLVRFIAEKTGKQQTLAASDLESFLESVIQFLNIGKPYYFDRIGSLTKLQTGGFRFTPGAAQLEKAAGLSDNETELDDQDSTGGFKSIFYAPKVKPSGRKILFLFLLVSGLGLAIWGGFTVYKKTQARHNDISNLPEGIGIEPAAQPVLDTTINLLPAATDSTATKKDSISYNSGKSIPGEFKFVVETTGRTRGLQRFALLKGFGLPVLLETQDSTVFKILFRLPASTSDTTRLRDSLQRLYTPQGQFAYVEQ
ncbi:MAG: hypothetical protein ACO25B_12730 [Chitinophagaceae bacterium]